MVSNIINYGWAILLAVAAVSLATYLSLDHTNPYKPVTVRQIEFLTPQPFVSNQRIEIRSGICNTTSSDVTVMVTAFGIRQVSNDPLTSDNIDLLAYLGNNRSFVIQHHICLADLSSTLLPPQVTVGKWQIYFAATVMGERASDIQRISILSREFFVVQ